MMKKAIWAILACCLLLTGCNVGEKVDEIVIHRVDAELEKVDSEVAMEEVKEKGLAIIDVTMSSANGETSLLEEIDVFTGSEITLKVTTSETIVGVDFIFSPTGTSGPYHNRPAEIYSLMKDTEGVFTTLPFPGPLHGSGYFIAFNENGVGIKSNTIYFQPDESHF